MAWSTSLTLTGVDSANWCHVRYCAIEMVHLLLLKAQGRFAELSGLHRCRKQHPDVRLQEMSCDAQEDQNDHELTLPPDFQIFELVTQAQHINSCTAFRSTTTPLMYTPMTADMRHSITRLAHIWLAMQQAVLTCAQLVITYLCLCPCMCR